MVGRNPGREQEIRERCVEIWRVLLPLARDHNARCISYTDLAEATGLTLNEIRKPTYLRRIHRYCNEFGFPPLDVLVVTQASWVPSRGYRALREVDLGDDYPGDDEIACLICRDREWVRGEDWARAPEEPGADNFHL